MEARAAARYSADSLAALASGLSLASEGHLLKGIGMLPDTIPVLVRALLCSAARREYNMAGARSLLDQDSLGSANRRGHSYGHRSRFEQAPWLDDRSG